VTLSRLLDCMIGFIAPYTFTARNYRQYSAIADLHTLQFTVVHALRFSVVTSRILVTDFSQTHTYEVFFSRLIPFLPLFCNCQFRRLDSITFLCSQAHIPAGWRPETQPFTSTRLLFYTILCCRTLLYNHFAETTQKT
jgi:hypothetical protein